MRARRSCEGRNTLLGQAETHSWQAVQCFAIFFAESDPGGVIGVRRFGATLSSMVAKPPSIFFFSCAKAAVETAAAAPTRKLRREVSAGSCEGISLDVSVAGLRRGVCV